MIGYKWSWEQQKFWAVMACFYLIVLVDMKMNTLHSLINAPAIMQIAAAISIIAPAIMLIAVAIIQYGAAFSIIVPAIMLIAGITYVLMIGR